MSRLRSMGKGARVVRPWGKESNQRQADQKLAEGNNAEIATGGSAGVAAAGISPEGKRGVQKGVAGDHGELLRGQSGAAFNERARPENPIETDAVGSTGCKVTVSRPMAGRPAPEWRCVCGSTGKRASSKGLVCFNCGRPV